MCWFHRIPLLFAVMVAAFAARAEAQAPEDGVPVKMREVVTVNERGWITHTLLPEETPAVEVPMYYGFVVVSRPRAAVSLSGSVSSSRSYYYPPERGVSHFESQVSPASHYQTPDGWSSVPTSRYVWTPDGWFDAW